MFFLKMPTFAILACNTHGCTMFQTLVSCVYKVDGVTGLFRGVAPRYDLQGRNIIYCIKNGNVP